ncbi:hypothetical protein M9458_004620, partial [Cirrhinus mrigala]
MSLRLYSCVWPAFCCLTEPDTASLSYYGGISCPSGQLAMAGEPSARRGSDVSWVLTAAHCFAG